MMGRPAKSTMLMSVAVSVGLTSAVWGATINVGDLQLSANQPDQWIEIAVSGGDPVAGVDLFLQVGDGGPPLADFGLQPGKAGPSITAVELKTGTIFQGVTDAPIDVGSLQLPQTAVFTLSLVGAIPTVPAEGILAKVRIDTTGFFGGTWRLQLDNVLPHEVFGGPYATNFAGLPADIQNGTLTIPITRGDYNGNQLFDAGDVDALAAALRAGSNDRELYDLNSDDVVDWSDHRFWVRYFARTFMGDSNLDGEFNSSDLVQIFTEGKYEDDVNGNASWESGDWNGDGDFTSSDLVLAFQEGGYESGSRRSVAAVPEPSSCVIYCIAIAIVLYSHPRDD